MNCKCNQGDRACECAEFPNLSNRWTLAIAVFVVAAAAALSAIFPLGVAT